MAKAAGIAFICAFMCVASQAWAGQGDAGAYGVLQSAHHFDEPGAASSIILFVMMGALGVADVILLGGNIHGMVQKKHQLHWGVLGILAGTITGLGLTPLLAEEGPLWALVPLLPAVALVTLGIINVATRPKPTAKPPHPHASPNAVLWNSGP